MNISSQSLRAYLKLANIYDGYSNKKKTDLVEMIVYGCMINKISKEPIKDISMNRALNILKEHDISIKSLPGYGNIGMKRKDIKPYTYECSIKIKKMNALNKLLRRIRNKINKMIVTRVNKCTKYHSNGVKLDNYFS